MSDLSQKKLNAQTNKWLQRKNKGYQIDADGDCLVKSALWLYTKKMGGYKRTELKALEHTISDWDGESNIDDVFQEYLAMRDTMERAGNIAYHLQPVRNIRHTRTFLNDMRDLKVEDSVTGICNPKELVAVFTQLAEEGSGSLIHFEDHTIAVFYSDRKFIFFDPNNPDGEIELGGNSENELTAKENGVYEIMVKLSETLKSIKLLETLKTFNESEHLNKLPEEYSSTIQHVLSERSLTNVALTIHKVCFADEKAPEPEKKTHLNYLLSDSDSIPMSDEKHESEKKTQLHSHIDFAVNSSKASESGITALMMASAKNDLVSLKKLLELHKREYLDKKEKTIGGTALYLAAQNGHEECVQLLLAAGANAALSANENRSPLYIAAQKNHLGVVTRLLEVTDCDLDQRTEDGTTALHAAVSQGYQNVAFTLIFKGADVNNQADDGSTPLYMACQNNDALIAEMLLNHDKIDVNLKSEDDNTTPLHIACEQGNFVIVQMLLKKNGIEIDCESEDGTTPLQNACESGNPQVIQALIESGADINHQSKQQITPLDAAIKNKRSEAVLLLLQKGAKLPVSLSRGKLDWLIQVANEHHQHEQPFYKLLREQRKKLTTQHSLFPDHERGESKVERPSKKARVASQTDTEKSQTKEILSKPSTSISPNSQ